MQIGDITIPAMRDFLFDDAGKSAEHIAGMGTTCFTPAEFTPDIPNVTFAGHMLQPFGSDRTLALCESDITALSEREVAHNYIHSVKGKRGYLAVGRISKTPNNSVLWPYEGSGKWYDSTHYTLKFQMDIAQMANTLNISTGNVWAAIPKDASYSGGDGVTTTKLTEDGTITFVRCNTSNVTFDLAKAESTDGEVRCYDGTTQVYYSKHLFSGYLTITNGLYSVILSPNTVTVLYYGGSTYTVIDNFTCGTFDRWWLSSCNPDKAIAHTSSGIIIEIERGRVPHVYSPSTMTCTVQNPTDQSTSTGINYLTLGSHLYVSGNVAFTIAAKGISAGHHWFYYDNSGTQAQQAKDCLMITNMQRLVIPR